MFYQSLYKVCRGVSIRASAKFYRLSISLFGFYSGCIRVPMTRLLQQLNFSSVLAVPHFTVEGYFQSLGHVGV